MSTRAGDSLLFKDTHHTHNFSSPVFVKRARGYITCFSCTFRDNSAPKTTLSRHAPPPTSTTVGQSSPWDFPGSGSTKNRRKFALNSLSVDHEGKHWSLHGRSGGAENFKTGMNQWRATRKPTLAGHSLWSCGRIHESAVGPGAKYTCCLECLFFVHFVFSSLVKSNCHTLIALCLIFPL